MNSAIDLHTHSTASDGSFTPTQLIEKAIGAGVETLALTDHDTVAGLQEAKAAAKERGLNLINGIELSTSWNSKTIHVVGLNIDADSPAMLEATIHLKQLREERAIKIGEKLAQAGIDNAYKNAKRLAANGTVTRQHFSRFLVEAGHAKNQTDVFKRFLVKNKPGFVSVAWPSLEETISRIDNAGGVAVIAHPLRYTMTATKLRNLIEEFKLSGGKAIEVVTGHNNAGELELATSYAKRFNIAASIGSDFHNEQTSWGQIGKLAALPMGLTPVWELW